MFKRIIPVVVVLVLLVAMIPFEAGAAETEGNYINLLDYCSATDTLGVDNGSNSFVLNGNLSKFFEFPDFLGSVAIYGFELTISYSGSVAPSISGVTGNSPGSAQSGGSVVPIVKNPAPGILRVRGSLKGFLASSITVAFSSSVETNINILSFNVYLSDVANIPIGCRFVGTYDVPYYADVPAGESYKLFFNDSVSMTNRSISIMVEDWRNFDSVYISGSIMCHTINSVTVYLHDNVSLTQLPIDFDINYIEGGAGSLNPVRRFDIIADLSSLDHAKQPDSTLEFVFDLSYSNSSANSSYFSFESCYGSIFIGSVDSEARLNAFMLGVLNGIYESFSNFSEFWALVYEEYTLPFQFGVIAGFDSIIDLLEDIAEGVAVDEEVTEDMTSSSDKLGDMTAQMQQGTPNISADDVNVNMSNLVSAGGMTAATSLAATITSDPLVSSMLMIVISLALVGFVFFGKR